MSKPQLYIFVGYPGAGKTTVAQIIHEKTGAVHIWADYERQRMFGTPDHTAPESKKLYHYLNHVTGHLLQTGKSVIFDTNFNFHKDREHLRKIAASHDAETTIIWITTPKAVAKRRAIEESDGQATRLYGNMSDADFERIAGHLQPPGEDEKVIKIDGTDLDVAELTRLLNL